MNIEARTDQSRWYKEADYQTLREGQPIVERLKNDLDPFLSVINSARRLAKIFPQEPNRVKPELINDERRLFNKPLLATEVIKDNLLYPERLSLAFESLIETHVHTTSYRFWSQINPEDLTDYARDRISLLFYKNVDFSRLSTTDPRSWLSTLTHYVSSVLKNLPANVNQAMPPEASLDDFLESIESTPEEHLVQKEWMSSFSSALQSLPEAQQSIIVGLINGKNGHRPDQIQEARQMIAEKLDIDYNERLFETQNDKRTNDVFQGLKLGQVFWLISQLPPFQQLALIHKFDYVYPEKTDLEAAAAVQVPVKTYRGFRQEAWNNIQKIINVGNIHSIDSFEKNLQQLKSLKAQHRLNGKPATTHALSTIIANQDSPKIKQLTELQQRVLSEIVHSTSYDEVAKKMGLSYQAVKIHACKIAKKLN